ncbi:phosphoglycerate kinase [Streptomyces sp. WAC 01529]|uniref:phosphoglycerate kinase n=1 Tax=Streptomyces sp. WAC 01529 TaxID=2203205 RepID=UPI000F6E9606|nr:phosphoglycerate kinase [Streptomyces sp. WAC 01529]AZM57169.1 phosphoglycerate kinase [Streptomyces sp. WAC 01529]
MSASTTLHSVGLLREQPIHPGQRWVYSAGFNVVSGMTDTSRIDCELDDLRYLADRGARVAILSHQGSHRDGTAVHLAGTAEYLGKRLGRPVTYIPESASDDAVTAARSLADGQVALFGNTRLHSGEEDNDPVLAAQFARLGDYAAIGGFSKAHRRHASNVGILRHLPGWAAGSLIDETRRLEPWAGRSPKTPSIAAVGGVKSEKSVVGLPCFARDYDIVVPGGIVLNHVLHHLGYAIGSSPLGNDVERRAAATKAALANPRARIHVPRRVVIARADRHGWHEAHTVSVSEGVPTGFSIVDFHLHPWLIQELRRVAACGGRLIIAGTPNLHTHGFTQASSALLDAARTPTVSAMLLGGDTVAELPFDGVTSTGGGSALCYLDQADVVVLDALRRNNGLTMRSRRAL